MKSAFFRIQITQIALSDILKNAPTSQRQHCSESPQIQFYLVKLLLILSHNKIIYIIGWHVVRAGPGLW